MVFSTKPYVVGTHCNRLYEMILMMTHNIGFDALYTPIPVKRGLHVFAKSIDSCQPAQSAQADMSRNFSLFSSFSACQRVILPHL